MDLAFILHFFKEIMQGITWRLSHKHEVFCGIKFAFKALSSLIKGISSIKEPIEDLKSILLRNLPKALIKKVVLFGSVAKGSEKVNSDIDVFILVKDKQSKKKLEPQIEKLSNLCFEIYGNRLAPYILTKQEMKRKKNLKVISEINKGIEIFKD